MGADLNDIADLPTPVGTTGTLQHGEAWSDELFEYTVGIVMIVSGGGGG